MCVCVCVWEVYDINDLTKSIIIYYLFDYNHVHDKHNILLTSYTVSYSLSPSDITLLDSMQVV